MTPEERAEYLRQWRKRHPSHYKRGVETYVCPKCGKTDTADGSVRAQSGLCLDCWCARENRRTDARLREKVADILGRREARGDGLREFHEAGEIVEVRPAPSPDALYKERIRELLHLRPAERSNLVREYHRAGQCVAVKPAPSPEDARRERRREYNRRYYEAHREERREAKRKYMKAHPEKNREAQRRYRLAHPEAQRRHYEAHKEEIKARVMAWQRAHPEKRHEYYLVRKLKQKQQQQQKQGEER